MTTGSSRSWVMLIDFARANRWSAASSATRSSA
jgi:hypothetical protein